MKPATEPQAEVRPRAVISDTITAFVLINVDKGRIPETAAALTSFPEVPEVYSVTGPYDLVAIVRVRHFERLAEVVTEQVAKTEGVLNTETLVAFRCYAPDLLERSWGIGMEEQAT